MADVIHTTDAPEPGGAYSQAVRAGGQIFTAGVVGRHPVDGSVPTDLRDEIRQALANLDAILTAAGGSRDTVLKTLCFLTDPGDFALFDEEYRTYFGQARPARSTVTVQLNPAYRFEIEAVALEG